jgi:hypothetical protein
MLIAALVICLLGFGLVVLLVRRLGRDEGPSMRTLDAEIAAIIGPTGAPAGPASRQRADCRRNDSVAPVWTERSLPVATEADVLPMRNALRAEAAGRGWVPGGIPPGSPASYVRGRLDDRSVSLTVERASGSEPAVVIHIEGFGIC